MPLDFQGPHLGRMIAFCLKAGKTKVLAITALMIALSTFADWRVGIEISLGVLYILPMMFSAFVLRPWEIVALAVVCAFLRGRFDSPSSQVEAALRFLFAWFAYTASGLFITALARNRQLVVEHLAQIEQEQGLRREAEEQLRVLVESSPAAVLTLDHKGVVLAANHAASSLFGMDQAETLEGRAMADYLPVLADALRLDSALTPFRTAAQCQGRRRNGEIFLAHTWFSTYQAPEGMRLAAIVVDASEEMRDREEQNLRQLAKGNRIITAAVSHEIRNLCGAISLIYSNLKDKLGLLHDEDFQGLGNLVKGLERIASLELQSLTQETLEEVPLQQVLDNLRIVIEPDWLDLDGAVQWKLPRAMPAVLGDSHGLLQTFLNLAQNSHRAVEQGDRRELRITVSVEKQKALVRFEDSGPGVSAPQLLFQPFQPGADGAGLGLYVSRALLRSYGGDLRFEPRPDGACFVVELQALEKEAQP